MSRLALTAALALAFGACGSSDKTAGPPDAAPVITSGPLAAEASCEGFELRGDLARDVRTGLEWTRFVEHEFATHDEAAQRCADRGMRLPGRAELETLMVPDGTSCKLPCGFHGHRCATLICDTGIAGTGDHWGVSFAAGGIVSVPADNAEAFICVR